MKAKSLGCVLLVLLGGCLGSPNEEPAGEPKGPSTGLYVPGCTAGRLTWDQTGLFAPISNGPWDPSLYAPALGWPAPNESARLGWESANVTRIIYVGSTADDSPFTLEVYRDQSGIHFDSWSFESLSGSNLTNLSRNILTVLVNGEHQDAPHKIVDAMSRNETTGSTHGDNFDSEPVYTTYYVQKALWSTSISPEAVLSHLRENGHEPTWRFAYHPEPDRIVATMDAAGWKFRLGATLTTVHDRQFELFAWSTNHFLFVAPNATEAQAVDRVRTVLGEVGRDFGGNATFEAVASDGCP